MTRTRLLRFRVNPVRSGAGRTFSQRLLDDASRRPIDGAGRRPGGGDDCEERGEKR